MQRPRTGRTATNDYTFHKQHDAAMESPNDASNVDDDSERSVTSSEISVSDRPNKFKGPKSTWRNFTEEERLVATSMTKLRDRDLSIHLYNAYAMKRCCYDVQEAAKLKPWANKVSSFVKVINGKIGTNAGLRNVGEAPEQLKMMKRA
jgi:hypothetical protein